MNEAIMRAFGFGKQVDLVKAKKCPLCAKAIDVGTFRDQLSLKEYGISGLCQACQDDIFKEE